MEAQNWINAIINSTDGHQAAVPSADLYKKIQARIDQYPRVSTTAVWLAAASLLLLIGLNFKALKQVQHTYKNQSVSEIASDLNKSNQLYQHE